MKPHHIYGIGCLVAAVVVGIGLFALPQSKPPPPEREPIAVRAITNEQLRKELAPIEQRFRGPTAMQIPRGFRCYSSESQRYRRVVIVCQA